jgi:hypothetical protein
MKKFTVSALCCVAACALGLGACSKNAEKTECADKATCAEKAECSSEKAAAYAEKKAGCCKDKAAQQN